MDRHDRRTFLANSLRTGTAVGLGGLATVGAIDATSRPSEAQGSTSTSSPGPAPATDTSGTPGAPTHLTVNGLVDPVGIDPDAPSFAWHVVDTRRGARQSGYQIVVTRVGQATPVWDSGIVVGAEQAFIAYPGPALMSDTSYHWSVATRDAQGNWGPPGAAVFVTGLRETDWLASWLRPGPTTTGPEEYTYVRSEVALPASPIVRAVAYVAAAHKYQLWLNGTKAATGPSFSYPADQYVQATDVTALLKAGGPNAVGVLHHWYGPGQGRPKELPALLLQLSVQTADGEHRVLGTDGTWRQLKAEWQAAPQRNSDGGDFVEIIDGRQSPVGWSEPGFDASGWEPAPVLGKVGSVRFAGLVAQRTTIAEKAVAPVSLRTLSNGSVVADFGKVRAARPGVLFHQGKAGRVVAMRAGYLLDPDGQVSTTHGTQGTNLSFTYTQRNGAQTFEGYTYLGYRYFQIDAPGEALTPPQVTAHARHAAMPPGGGASFSSDHPTVDAVWGLCTHSALFSCQEQFIDTPTREKGQFLWDASNESEGVMRAFGDQNMSWQGLRDFQRSQARYWPDGEVNAVYPNGDGKREFPNFTERYPEWVWRYYLSTGDAVTAVARYPTVRRIADFLWRHVDSATGLVRGLLLTSSEDWNYGYDFNTVSDTTINVLAVNAFRRAGQLAGIAGDTQRVATMSSRAAKLTAAINKHLLRSDGVYIDGLRADGTRSTVASQQANALALAYGVVPSKHVSSVGALVKSLGISVQPDHGMELLRGLDAAGLHAAMVHVLTNAAEPGWAHILKAGGTYTWEVWRPNDAFGDSMSHGWGSSALVAMQEALLGARPTPLTGGAALEFAPPSGGLGSAAGVVPTVAGPLRIRWSRSGTQFQVTLSVPPNASVVVRLPTAVGSTPTESGMPITEAPGVQIMSEEAGFTTVVVQGGTYSFASTSG